jgi:hypothetical protein
MIDLAVFFNAEGDPKIHLIFIKCPAHTSIPMKPRKIKSNSNQKDSITRNEIVDGGV